MKPILVLVLLVGGAAGALFMTPLGAQLGLGSSATEAPASESGPLPAYKMKDRVMNLADAPDQAGRGVLLKITVVFEFTGRGVRAYQAAKPLERAKVETEIVKTLAPREYALQDALTTIVGGRRKIDLDAAGQERLRQDIQKRFNELLQPDYSVIRVYLPEFIYQ